MSNYHFFQISLNQTDPNWRLDTTPHLWGSFSGLFGLPTNHRFIVSSEPIKTDSKFQIIKHEMWKATARPTSFTPLSKAGLYVFRQFDLHRADIDKLVSLSQKAWLTFENDSEFTAKVAGLFVSQVPLSQDIVSMRLVTWYDSFESWQRSRNPHPDAKKNFCERGKLVISAMPIATGLLV